MAFVDEPPPPPRSLSAGSHAPRQRLVCSSLRPWPWLQLNARFYQAEPAPVVRTAKCPVPLCLMLLLSSSGRRGPPPAGTLLPGHSSYGHMCQSRLALLSFGYSPGSRSLCRLLPAPAATRIFPTLFCDSFLRCLSPYPGGPTECICLVLPQCLRPSPLVEGSASRFFRLNDFLAGQISRLQLFRNVQASEFARLPDRPHRCGFPQGGRGFTSELNVRRYLGTHRICYPPDYRQLAGRGLSPRKTRSIVGCSLQGF